MVKKSDSADRNSGENGYSNIEKEEFLDWDDIFDIIQAEYGWPDEILVNMTRKRIISVANKILKRKIDHNNMLNNIARGICSYIINTSMVTVEGKEAMLKSLYEKEKNKEIKYNSAENMMSVFSHLGG